MEQKAKPNIKEDLESRLVRLLPTNIQWICKVHKDWSEIAFLLVDHERKCSSGWSAWLGDEHLNSNDVEAEVEALLRKLKKY